MMSNKKLNNELEEFKFLIDSRVLSNKEKRDEREAILRAREKRFSNRSENEKKVSRLLQLKYQMENYLSNQKCIYEPLFPKFLSTYIDTLYDKRKNFAIDININPITLSQVINQHRDPQENFLIRLIVHSESAYKNLCSFEKELWPKIYYQDKVCEFLTSSEKSIKFEKKHVKNKEFEVE